MVAMSWSSINVSCPVSHPCAIHCSIAAACCVSVLRGCDIRVLLIVPMKGSGHMRVASPYHTRSCRCSTSAKGVDNDPLKALAPPRHLLAPWPQQSQRVYQALARMSRTQRGTGGRQNAAPGKAFKARGHRVGTRWDTLHFPLTPFGNCRDNTLHD